MTEMEKMLAGKVYDPNDKTLLELRAGAHRLCKLYNDTFETDVAERERLLDELIPSRGKGTYLQGPVFFDYGRFTAFGENCYANFNLTVLDVCPVTIGNNVFMGPNVSILTPKHPLCHEERNIFFDKNKGYSTDSEYGAPITIGDNCWIAGNVTILAGVNIGAGTVIGGGSVVTKDIPAGVLAYGNPCRPARHITPDDRIALKKHLW